MVRGPKPRLGEREHAMKASYEAGFTLDEVGQLHGVSRERVRQILSRRFGMSGRDGGHCVRGKIHERQVQEARNERYMQKYGMSRDEFFQVRETYGTLALRRYSTQVCNSRKRGIPWEFDFASWIKFWTDSGHWDDRGRGFGYGMCRYGDVGPYSPTNCYIATSSDNMKHYYLYKRARKDLISLAS